MATQLAALPQALTAIASNLPWAESLEGMLKAAREFLGMEVAFISAFEDGRRVFKHVDVASTVRGVEPGGSDPLEDTYCQRQVDGRLPALIPDTARNPEAASLPITEQLGIKSYVGVPLRTDDGSTYGTFCCFSSEVSPLLNERDLRVVKFLAHLIESQIQLGLRTSREGRERRERIGSVLRGDGMTIVFQPILEIAAERMAGGEALSRFTVHPQRTPDVWFREAAEVGLHIELEVMAVQKAIEALDALPEPLYLAVNVSPATAMSRELAGTLGRCDLRRVVLEVTEHAAVGCYQELTLALAPYRQAGLRLAIDDAGAGYSSFQHILRLAPDIIKLDMSFTRDIDKDPSRRALAAAMVRFSADTGARLVAEGVETSEELDILRALGVTFAQGYFLGKPGQLPTVH